MKKIVFLSVFVLSFAYLAVASPARAPVAGANHSREIQPVRTRNGKVALGPHFEMQSSNWSGYVVSNYITGKTYTSAASTWIVPSVTGSGYSSSWVGIGGSCLNSICSRVDHTLIQLGTEQDASGYYAWYEMLPNPEIKISTLSINPGDKISASLTLKSSSKNSQTWLLTLNDLTTSKSWSNTFSYKSSFASAEWIEEAPSSVGGVLPLANYGTATFDPGTVNNGQNPALIQSNGIIMMDPYGQTSNPSAPDSDTDGFNTCWGSGTLTSCPVPAS